MGCPIPGRSAFLVTEPFIYRDITIPPTRRTNWASVPRAMESFTGIDGLPGAYPSTVHDELYYRGPELGYNREEADRVFWEILRSIGATRDEADRAWRVLRLGGGPAWRACRE